MVAQLEVTLGGMIQGGATTMSGWAAANNKKRKSAGYWEEERDMVVQLMMGRPLHHLHLDVNRPSCTSVAADGPLLPPPPAVSSSSSTTLDLLGSNTTYTTAGPPPPLPFHSDDATSSSFDLDSHSPLPSGWEKCLDLQTGSIYYLNRSTGLSTSCDPRKAATSSVNRPTSPSSSSDLTFEANVPMASSSKPNISTPCIEEPNYEFTNLDLTLSLKPSSPRLRPISLNHSLNHDLKSDPNHNFRSLISSQGLLNNHSFASSISSFPINSTSHIKTSFAKLPTCTSSTTSYTSPSSPTTLFFQELNAPKDMGSLGSSISSKESKPFGMNQNFIGISRPSSTSNNVNINVREKPIARETHNPSPISKNFSGSGKAKPTISDTHINASSPMITVGCANCLMFVMLPKSCSPKCPRCGASIDSDLPQPPLSIKKPKLAFSLMN